MTILSAATAFPGRYYSQSELVEAFRRNWGPKLDNPQLLDWLHSRVAVDGRWLAYPPETYENLHDFGHANDLWISAALDLGERAITSALDRARLAPADLSAIYFVSITGISNPSIDARLVNRLRLSPFIRRVPVFGLGCVAGAAGLAMVADYVRAHPTKAAVLLSVELCSLTIQRDDLSMANLISAGLFGDGAAATIVAGSEHPLAGKSPRILATKASFYPDTEDVMGWKVTGKGFEIVLSPRVPEMVEKFFARDVDAFLAENNLTRSSIGSWIAHTGGPRVLEAMEAALGLPKRTLEPSWESLRKVGNLSSASVLAVLESYLTDRRPAPGEHSVLAAMGPGFCSELVLLQW